MRYESLKEHYAGLRERNPSMTIEFKREACCEESSEPTYSIPDWYEGGHYFAQECRACGREWWMDEHELMRL